MHNFRRLVTYLVSSQQPLHWWHSVPHWWSLAVAAAEPAEDPWVAIIAHACEHTASIGQRSAGWWQLNAAMHGAHTSMRKHLWCMHYTPSKLARETTAAARTWSYTERSSSSRACRARQMAPATLLWMRSHTLAQDIMSTVIHVGGLSAAQAVGLEA